MLTNKDLIVLHLIDFLETTKQVKTLHWWGVLNYCLGYYEVITPDIICAVRDLERLGYILPSDG